MAIVKVVNNSTVHSGLEFINTVGQSDRCTIMSKQYIHVEESRITTSIADLTRRGLKIMPLFVTDLPTMTVPAAEEEPTPMVVTETEIVVPVAAVAAVAEEEIAVVAPLPEQTVVEVAVEVETAAVSQLAQKFNNNNKKR